MKIEMTVHGPRGRHGLETLFDLVVQSRLGRAAIGTAVVLMAACASAPPPPPPAPVLGFEQKMAWILRLEDQRILTDPAPQVLPPPVVTGRRGQAPPPAPPPPPSLIRLLSDPDPRIRRRAALGIGHVGLADGVAPLVASLSDGEAEVRQIAAFGLGLIGDCTAVAPLRAALADPSVVVQGRAAEALGLIGDVAVAPAIGEMVAGKVAGASRIAADELGFPLAPEVEAFRLGVYALARLKTYDALAAATLETGQPRVRWWPVAYALQRVEDKRAAPALMSFVRTSGVGASFAARGLGALKERGAVPLLMALVENARADPRTAISAMRGLAEIGDVRGVPSVLRMALRADAPTGLAYEATLALAGFTGSQEAIDSLLDLLSNTNPAIRAAAVRALSKADRDIFLTVLSGMDPDSHWSVRAAVAESVGALGAELAIPRLEQMLRDSDQRVIPAVLAGLVKIKAPSAQAALLEHLSKPDPVVRLTAAQTLGELKPPNGVPALVSAYQAAVADTSYVVRGAILGALAKYGTPDAIEAMKGGLTDKDWAVRVRAATLLAELDRSGTYTNQIRPAPSLAGATPYDSPMLVNPSVSPHAYVDTAKGTFQIELAVLDAPRTVDNFIVLARRGFFNSMPIHRVVPNFVVQAGDPRGDGEGGPGYTIRDELNEVPFLRGTVGMALDWRDTGGSQFFVTHSPQPHLDARYTVFGRVISGMEVVDGLQQWDVIDRIRIWDGTTPMR